MANGKLPPEIHLVKGSKGLNQGVLLPESIKVRIPFAEWASRPESFTKEVFIEETANYLFEVYGIGSDQDRHTLMMLADQLETYIHARSQQSKHPLVVKINDGKTLAPNPYIAVANEAMKNCVRLMNELGLTPKSRLTSNKPEQNSAVARFLQGPKAAKA
jgi:P27 family predicted phage terminase small subunit